MLHPSPSRIRPDLLMLLLGLRCQPVSNLLRLHFVLIQSLRKLEFFRCLEIIQVQERANLYVATIHGARKEVCDVLLIVISV